MFKFACVVYNAHISDLLSDIEYVRIYRTIIKLNILIVVYSISHAYKFVKYYFSKIFYNRFVYLLTFEKRYDIIDTSIMYIRYIK